MANARYEEALENLKDAQKRESEMNELIRDQNKVRSKKNEELAELNGRVRTITHARMVLESALKNCEEIRNTFFPSMKSELELASAEYSKTFDADFVSVSLQSVYEDDLGQTKEEIDAVYIELQEKVRKIQAEETGLNESIRGIKRDISNLTGLIEEYVKKRNSYSDLVEEYRSLV